MSEKSQTKEILYSEVIKHFGYCENSPSKLVRVFCKNDRKKAGLPTGKLFGGYWRTSFNGRSFQVSRLVYCLCHGNMPKSLVIDHIDPDKTNNSISNLRAVESVVNNRNKPKSKANKTGSTGVSFVEIDNRCGKINTYFRAVISDGILTTVKSFNIAKFGRDKAFRLAVKFREDTLKTKLFYSERHGK